MSNYSQQYQVTEEMKGLRIDKYLAETITDLSRSYIQKTLKEENVVLVNEHSIKANYKVNAGDMIVVTLPENIEPEIIAENIPLDILFEDDDLIIVNKPKGMVVHPSAGHHSGTMVNALMYHCKGRLSSINGVVRPGIVHRIDMDTTGVLIVCKTDVAHQHIAAQLKEHSITRKYHAIVRGRLKELEGTIAKPIGRHPNERKKMAVNFHNGKEAITHYKVLKNFTGYSYVECQLETGRTHQIRVHLTSIHHPLLGDNVYGATTVKMPMKLVGQTLHAMTIGFIHPRTEQYMEFNAPLPAYFEKLLTIL